MILCLWHAAKATGAPFLSLSVRLRVSVAVAPALRMVKASADGEVPGHRSVAGNQREAHEFEGFVRGKRDFECSEGGVEVQFHRIVAFRRGHLGRCGHEGILHLVADQLGCGHRKGDGAACPVRYGRLVGCGSWIDGIECIGAALTPGKTCGLDGSEGAEAGVGRGGGHRVVSPQSDEVVLQPAEITEVHHKTVGMVGGVAHVGVLCYIMIAVVLEHLSRSQLWSRVAFIEIGQCDFHFRIAYFGTLCVNIYRVAVGIVHVGALVESFNIGVVVAVTCYFFSYLATTQHVVVIVAFHSTIYIFCRRVHVTCHNGPITVGCAFIAVIMWVFVCIFSHRSRGSVVAIQVIVSGHFGHQPRTRRLVVVRIRELVLYLEVCVVKVRHAFQKVGSPPLIVTYDHLVFFY